MKCSYTAKSCVFKSEFSRPDESLFNSAAINQTKTLQKYAIINKRTKKTMETPENE